MPRVGRVIALLAPVVLWLAPAPAAAQQLDRNGFFFGVGFGYGGLDLTCDICNVGREGSYSGNLRLGYAINDRFLIGAETEGWYKDNETGWITAGTLTASAYYYPAHHLPLFVRGGVGMGLLQVGVDDLGDDDTETGVGWSVGAGYDIAVGETTALTPYFNWMWGDLEDNDFNIYQFGLAISVY